MKCETIVNGPETIKKYEDGSTEFFLNGKLHSDVGPAQIFSNGYKAWWKNGKRHRIDGPAIDYYGRGFAWFIDDQEVTPIEMHINDAISLLLNKSVKIIP